MVGAIAEGVEFEEKVESDEDVVTRYSHRGFNLVCVPETDYLQAFSHYSYRHSKARFMFVDLQVSFRSRTLSNGAKVVLTDPAIHQKRRGSDGRSKRHFRRTDLRELGVKVFLPVTNTVRCVDCIS